MTPNHEHPRYSYTTFVGKEAANTAVFSLQLCMRSSIKQYVHLEQLQSRQKYLVKMQLLNTVVRCVKVVQCFRFYSIGIHLNGRRW